MGSGPGSAAAQGMRMGRAAVPRAAAFALSGGRAAGLAGDGAEGGGFCRPRAGKEGQEHAKGYLGCGKPRGGRRESPHGAAEGAAGPAGGGEVRALRGGNACGTPAPAAREEAAGERRSPPALPRGAVAGGHCPTAPLRVGSRGRALSPTAERGGHRSPQPHEGGGGSGCAGPRSLAGVEGTERSWGARVLPVNTAAGQNTFDGSTPRLPHRGIKSKPGLLPPGPCGRGPRRCRAGACPKAHKWLSLKGTESREGRRGRGSAAGVGARLPRMGQAAPRKGRPPWGHCGAPPGQPPPWAGEGRLRAERVVSLASAPPAMAPPAPRQAPLPPAKCCQGF